MLSMYCRPHLICVPALVCQSGPALAILLPGSACGMPYAPELALLADTLQPLSRCHSESRQENWPDIPSWASSPWAICCADPEEVAATVAACCWAVFAAAAFAAAAFAAAARWARICACCWWAVCAACSWAAFAAAAFSAAAFAAAAFAAVLAAWAMVATTARCSTWVVSDVKPAAAGLPWVEDDKATADTEPAAARQNAPPTAIAVSLDGRKFGRKFGNCRVKGTAFG